MAVPDFDNSSKWGRWWLSLPRRWRVGVAIAVVLFGSLGARLIYGKFMALQNKIGGLSSEVVTKRDEMTRLEARVAELHRENLHYRELLDPIRQKAEQLYPLLETDAAVAQLAQDINEVRELATRDIYKPLSPARRGKVVSDLRNLRGKYSYVALKVSVVPEQGSQRRILVAQELASLLAEAGIDATAGRSVLTFTNNPVPIRITLNPSDIELVQELAKAMAGFVDAKFSGNKKNGHPSGTFEIWIAGDPVFSPDGIVTFR